MRDNKDKSKRTVLILSIVIAVLVIAMVYLFIARPMIQTHQDNLRVEGVNYAVSSILASIQSQGYVEIPVGNQTLILVPYVPSQAQNQTQ